MRPTHLLGRQLRRLLVRDQLVLLVVIEAHAHPLGSQLDFDGLVNSLLIAAQPLSFLQAKECSDQLKHLSVGSLSCSVWPLTKAAA